VYVTGAAVYVTGAAVYVTGVANVTGAAASAVGTSAVTGATVASKVVGSVAVWTSVDIVVLKTIRPKVKPGFEHSND